MVWGEQGDVSCPDGLVFGNALRRLGTSAGLPQTRQRCSGLDPAHWTPQELRHSFVSLLSDNGIPLEEISRLVGHSSTAVTEAVYRKQIRPVLQAGAVAMDRIFEGGSEP